ncbi:hypothetical protein L1987_39627 [Smallanthus sonchifolius]|uniref:Uncharacterized protein n=1 Tax=Smallanthus sonchifolius TaxID=185202 RepID=A0ACB9HP96_9ASTR|nr:hypothetical protein L1987_39627 [Smallanthus sonchifolius]
MGETVRIVSERCKSSLYKRDVTIIHCLDRFDFQLLTSKLKLLSVFLFGFKQWHMINSCIRYTSMKRYYLPPTTFLMKISSPNVH